MWCFVGIKHTGIRILLSPWRVAHFLGEFLKACKRPWLECLKGVIRVLRYVMNTLKPSTEPSQARAFVQNVQWEE